MYSINFTSWKDLLWPLAGLGIWIFPVFHTLHIFVFTCLVSIFTNGLKAHGSRKHLIISTDARKAFGKIQYPFVIKSLSKLELEVTNLTMGSQEKSAVNMLMKTKCFPSEVRNKARSFSDGTVANSPLCNEGNTGLKQAPAAAAAAGNQDPICQQ